MNNIGKPTQRETPTKALKKIINRKFALKIIFNLLLNSDKIDIIKTNEIENRGIASIKL